jgi:hypothetical protein
VNTSSTQYHHIPFAFRRNKSFLGRAAATCLCASGDALEPELRGGRLNHRVVEVLQVIAAEPAIVQ